jgi:hypothetical protein
MGLRSCAAIAAGVLLLPLAAVAAAPARVAVFSPEGVAKQVQQVTATFSDAMVPFGAPSHTLAPFRIDCPAQGSARWIDERTWAYDFPSPLSAGLLCRFDLSPELKTLGGRPLGGTRAFSFSTGGPAILRSDPYAGESITDDQAFLLRLDADAVEDSVLRSVVFSVAGSRDPVGVRVLAGAEREEILGTLGPDERTGPWLVLQARQRFPADTKVTLQWGAGVRTASGIATAKPQLLHFKVRPPFRTRVQCGRERPKADCVPISSVRLLFSSPVAWSAASRVALVLERAGQPALRVVAERADADDDDPLVDRIRFRGPLAPNARYRIEIPDDLRDDAGRTLAPPAPGERELRTAGYPPLAKFPARFGILERYADPALPVTLRALEPEVKARLLGPAAGQTLPARAVRVAEPSGAELLGWLRRLETTEEGTALLPAKQPGVKNLALPLARPPASGDSEVIGIPLGGPGLHLVEIESRILGDRLLDPPRPMVVVAGALVTDLAVHFAWGRDSSLVWVTSLAHATPVPDAKVAVLDCHGATRWEGKTDAAGVARIEELPPQGKLERCEHRDDRWSAFDDGLLVTASKDGDLGFVHSSWTDGIEAWRFQLPTGWWGDSPLVGHTVFARTLLRAGETVHMKHIVRKPTLSGFALPAAEELPNEIVIRHGGSGQEFVLPLALDAAGTAVTEWQTPPGSKLGSWQVSLRRGGAGGGPALDTGAFRVEEFRLPYMRGTIHAPSEPQIGVQRVLVDVAVQFLAGGAASNLETELRSELRPRESLPFEDAPGLGGFVFGRGAVAAGVRRGGLETACDGEDCPPDTGSHAPKIETKTLRLDAAGTGRAEIPVDSTGRPRELAVELAYRDPAGAVQTASTRVALWPSSRVVGLRVEGGWRKPADVRAVAMVVDLAGKPVAGAPVTVEAFERRSYTHRRRLVGGFYSYTSVEEIRPLRRFCEGRTDAFGRLVCDGAIEGASNVVLEARSPDPQGRPAITQDETWLVGDDTQWFEPADGDRMDLLPEKRAYEPGETARFQVRIPFREAMALVTVERSGVGRHTVVTLSGKDPVIEVPLTGADAPNVFVSVLAVRGRVGDVLPTARVDLGRPAYRLGIAEVQVGWKQDRLDVKVTPEREVYRVREKAQVAIAVAAASGAALPAGTEVAVAAVDEALLELLPNQSWELLPAMMGRRSFGVSTATAQGLVIGKRHFGLKALPHGGGGGRRPTRELFDTLLLWQGRVPLDAKGRALVEVPLNDSLTSFRIAAVAMGGLGLFGTGSATIRSTQDLMALPGLPPVVRDGDRFRARFTLRNTTQRSLDVALAAQVKGLPAALAPIRESLAAGEARELSWDVTVPSGTEALAWDVAVQTDGKESDRLHVSQRVVPSVPVRVFQGLVAPLDPELRLPLERPAGAIAGQGGVDVTVKAKLSDGLDGVEEFLRRYPYGCLEQRISRAVGLRDAAAWQALVDRLPSDLDEDGLAKFFPSMREGSPVLTSYLLSISNEAGLALPDATRSTLLDALTRFVEGSLARSSVVPAPDLPLRKLAALAALARHGRAKPAMLGGLTLEPVLWPTSALLDWISILRRTPGIPRSAERLREARALLRARLVLQGTTLTFTTQSSDDLAWLLATPDTNAARAILEGLADRTAAREMARLVRGALGSQVRGGWDSTMADAWGVVALDRFSKAFESTPVSGAVEATLAGVSRRLAWGGASEPATRFDWPNGKGELFLRQDGPGRPWAMVQSRAAVALDKPLLSGFTLAKSVTPLVQKTPGSFSRGDVVKVKLEATAQTAQAWVVVRDPIPTGATVLGSGLGGGSLVANAAAGQTRCPCPVYAERSFEAFTQFYEWVPQGPFQLEYVMVLNQDGSFALPPTRVEAMYARETFAELPNARVVVAP